MHFVCNMYMTALENVMKLADAVLAYMETQHEWGSCKCRLTQPQMPLVGLPSVTWLSEIVKFWTKWSIVFLGFMYIVAVLKSWEYIKTMQEFLCLNVQWNSILGLDNYKCRSGRTLGCHAHCRVCGIPSQCSLKVSSAPQPLWLWGCHTFLKAWIWSRPSSQRWGCWRMWLQAMGSILQDEFISQLKQLFKSWRKGWEDASMPFWGEISFFVLIQISPCSLQKTFEERKGEPRGTIHESKRQPSMALPSTTPSAGGALWSWLPANHGEAAFLCCILTDEMPSLFLSVYSEPCLFWDLFCVVVKRAEHTEKSLWSYISVIKTAECVYVVVDVVV